MDKDVIEIEIRTVDEDNNEERMYKKYSTDSTDNGLDAYFLYENLISFMKMCGYCDNTITHIKWVEKEETIVISMAQEICNLRGLELTDENIKKIVEEFKEDK